MSTLNLLFETEYAINDQIKIMIPSVGEVIDNEDEYYSVVNLLTSMPIDLMLPLYDAGIDFTEISEYELFMTMFPTLAQRDTHLIFGDLDISKFQHSIDKRDKSLVLYDYENDIVIDRRVQQQIAATLRKIHHLEKNRKKPANKEAKEYMLKRAKEKSKRKRRTQDSQLETLIVAMVNAQPYKYDFDGTRNLSIYQFNECVRQVIKKTDYDNLIHGIYAGRLDADKIRQSELDWLHVYNN